MTVKACTKNGESGFQYGDEGTCYTGDNAKKRAERQGKAVRMRQDTSNSGAYRGVGDKRVVGNRKKLKGMLKEAGQ